MNELTFDEIEKSASQHPIDDIPDSRDYEFDEIMGFSDTNEPFVGDFPETFKLDIKSTVKSQGTRGTCGAFAATGIDEYFHQLFYSNVKLDLSEEYLFSRIKEFDIKDYNYDGYGSYARSGAKAVIKYGTCLESLMPYRNTTNEQEWKNTKYTPKINEDAARHKLLNYFKVSKSVEGMKRAIYQSQAPILIGITLYESYRQAKTNGGHLPLPKSGEKQIGGHLMWAYAYDAKGFTCRNSFGIWGTSKGDLIIPWEALGIVHASMFSFIDIENNIYVDEDKLIEFNKKFCKDYQLSAWNKAIQKNLITGGSKASDVMTKGDYFVFLDRQNQL